MKTLFLNMIAYQILLHIPSWHLNNDQALS